MKSFPKEVIFFAQDYLKIKNMPDIGFFENAFSNQSGNYDSENKFVNINIALLGDLEKHSLRILETLFHELVHHVQFEKGILKNANGIYFWKKRKAKGKGYKISSWKDYFNSPHEIQARAISKNMLKEYEKLS